MVHRLIFALLAIGVPFIAGTATEGRKHHHRPHIVDGLSWTFYDNSCPNLQSVVRSNLIDVINKDVGVAAGLIRIPFHDCFVQGCDGSVLLTGTNSELNAIPNQSLRQTALDAINNLHSLVSSACGAVVSCADIIILAARDAAFLSGGPFYEVPLGRRDSISPAPASVVLANLVSPFSDVSALLGNFSSHGLDAVDLVALSGAHTVGRAHCGSFSNRLPPNVDATLDPPFAAQLAALCPNASSTNVQPLDILTPNQFDNAYYWDLEAKRGLLTSDEGLFFDDRTKGIVQQFAGNQGFFFDRFVNAMVKMGQLGVLTGSAGEVRTVCTAPNGATGADGWAAVA